MLKNILRVLSANGIVAIVGLVSSLLLPQLLSIDDYATYQTFTLYLSYVAILHLGFPTGMNIKYAGKKLDQIDKAQYRSEIRILLIILAFFSTIGLVLYAITSNTMLLYVSLMTFMYCFLGSFSLLVQAWEKFTLYAILHILMSAVPLLIPILYYAIMRSISSTVCILAYVVVYAATVLGCLIYHFFIVKGIKSKGLLSKENWGIEKIGFFFLLGNYINSLLHSIDKQFVKWYCVTSSFSFYSFGLTMQSTMTIFITAIAQPLFPYMASGKIKGRDQLRTVKRWLLMLGSLSGLAYFACAFIVNWRIKKYTDSLPVIRVYFAVFPAMAVVNCLYFNLYKIQKMTKRYIFDLSMILVVAAAANYLAVQLGYGYVGVAFATTVVNYLWLVYGTVVFKELRLDLKECLFISLFLLEFCLVPMIGYLPLCMVVYFGVDLLISIVCFKSEVEMLCKRIVKPRKAR